MWLIPTIRLTLLLLIKNSNNVVHSSVLRVLKVEGQMKEDKLFVIQYYQNLSKGTFLSQFLFIKGYFLYLSAVARKDNTIAFWHQRTKYVARK